jgi:hypothetical protein
MKTLFLALLFALMSLPSFAQNQNPFSIELDGAKLTGVQSNFELTLALTQSPTGSSTGKTRTGMSTDMELKRQYQHSSDWKTWAKDYLNSRNRTKNLILKYIDAQGKENIVIRRSDAYPIGYKITADGFEVMMIKVNNIDLD